MKVNFITETSLFPVDHGVHTASLTLMEMARIGGYEVFINSFKNGDITHIQTIGPYALFKLLTAKNVIVSAHVIPDSFIGSLKSTKYWLPLVKAYLKFYYNKADIVLAVAPYVKKKLEELGVRSRIEVLPNPVNESNFYQDSNLRTLGKKILGLKGDSFVFISVGQVQPRKGVSDFIKLAKEFPQARFIWLGGKPFKNLTAENKEMNDLIKTAPVNFEFKGPFDYDQMPALYNAADAFLFPSFQENASMALIEAGNCGLPLILRDIPEYKELYNEGYIACANYSAFKVNIIKIMNDNSFFQEWQKNSLKLSSKYHISYLTETQSNYYSLLTI